MSCTKPNCDCVEKEIAKQGTEFIKNYPCLHGESIDELAKVKSNHQPMSETKLPKEVIEQIDLVCKTVYEIGYVPFEKHYMQQGATIAAAHYQTENKRLVDEIKILVEQIYNYDEGTELKFNKYWQQYCKDNGIKE